MTANYFVTASGTDVGKTYVLCSILQQLRERGVTVRALKPVISGYVPDTVSGSDTGQILAALGQPVTAANVVALSPWRFREPLSPDMAAAREGRTIPFEDVAGFCRTELARPDATGFVEGAGGVMSPLGYDFTNLDLIASLKFKSLLVVGGYLGTISHTLTALAAMQARDCAPVAVVMSGFQAGPVSLDETAASIRRFADVPLFAVERGGSVPSALIEMLTRQGRITMGVPTFTDI